MENLTQHMMALWPLSKVGPALREGFAKTGMFPFDPAVVESVKKRKFTPRVWTKSDPYAMSKQKLKDVLGEMNLSPSDIAAIVTEADRRSKFNTRSANGESPKKKGPGVQKKQA